MKPILLSSILLLSIFSASAQTATPNLRYGAYVDFGNIRSVNFGGAVVYSPVKWACLRTEAGVLFLIGNSRAQVNAPNANVVIHKPALHSPHLSLDVTPSIHLSKTFSLDFNIRSLIGQLDNTSNLYFSPGFTLRHGRFEIRTRFSYVEEVNIGLVYFPGKKVK